MRNNKALSCGVRFSTIVYILLSVAPCFAQDTHSPVDSVRVLTEVVVQGFQNYRPLSEVAASIELLSADRLLRFSNTSFVTAVNTLAGVRMEERSPGSYRFSIRGSLVRSPFGVRNVKFYWKNLPFTDGGGNTYLNLLDFGSIGSMEIIKGPGASLYGAGTGGVVLVKPPSEADDFSFSVQHGSFGLFRAQASASLLSSAKNSITASTSFQQSEGYRAQSAMRRFSTLLDWDYFISARTSLTTSFLTSNLFYETPGGLTKTQLDADPRQARPSAGPNAGAAEQQATVYNTTHYLSSFLQHEWGNGFSLQGGVFGSYTDFKNPSIRNYEIRQERNAGTRAELRYTTSIGQAKSYFIMGGEYQYFNSPINVSDNLAGTRGNLQFSDNLSSSTGLAFTQVEIEFRKQIILTVGGSLNFLSYTFNRNYPQPLAKQKRNFEPCLFPRIALLKKFSESFSLFGSVSNGFSPPSLAEVRPSTNTFNNSLQAERGTNLEVGFRGNTLAKQLSYDVTLYNFKLKKTIVIQRTTDGADYFVNAGETSQLGLEISSTGTVLKNKNLALVAWVSYSMNEYHFKKYVQDGVDYSNKRLTGVAPNVASFGLDLRSTGGLYLHSTIQYTDHIPLNDANTNYAPYYWLMSARLGYKKLAAKNRIDAFVGVDNALNAKYSLGNDLNAFGGRYYNAAAVRNYFVGLSLTFPTINR